MSSIRGFLCTELECSLFHQIALFSAGGFAVSLTLVLACDLQIAGQWL
jgi:hypothetical protein